MDNLNIHISDHIMEAIEAKSCIIKYLPPYSPDYNPIELTFSVLKAWMRRHFWYLRQHFERDFGGFIKFATENSGCDRLLHNISVIALQDVNLKVIMRLYCMSYSSMKME